MLSQGLTNHILYTTIDQPPLLPSLNGMGRWSRLLMVWIELLGLPRGEAGWIERFLDPRAYELHLNLTVIDRANIEADIAGARRGWCTGAGLGLGSIQLAPSQCCRYLDCAFLLQVKLSEVLRFRTQFGGMKSNKSWSSPANQTKTVFLSQSW